MVATEHLILCLKIMSQRGGVYIAFQVRYVQIESLRRNTEEKKYPSNKNMQQSWTLIKLQLKEIYSKLQISEARWTGVTVFTVKEVKTKSDPRFMYSRCRANKNTATRSKEIHN